MKNVNNVIFTNISDYFNIRIVEGSEVCYNFEEKSVFSFYYKHTIKKII